VSPNITAQDSKGAMWKNDWGKIYGTDIAVEMYSNH